MSLIHNLRIWQKFALLGLISLLLSVPLATMVIGGKRTEAAIARQEVEGLEPAEALLKLLQVTQQHRGLSAGYLNGNAAMGAQREARQRDVDAGIARMTETLSRYDRPAIRERREAIVAAWRELPAAVATRSLTAAESFARHTALVDLQIRALEDVLDASAMALDPEAATYYLMQAVFIHLPPVAESLGQLRARGTSALSASALPPGERVWIQLKQQSLRASARAMQEAYRKAYEADPNLSSELTGKIRAAAAAFESVVALTDRVLLAPEVPAYDASTYFKEVTDAVDRQFALADDTFGAISSVLHARADTAERTTAVAIAGFLGAIACSGWLIVSMSRRSAQGVREAVAAARALAEGDLTHRLDHRSRDEIGEIAAAIDSAMTSLSSTIAQVLESVDAVASASAQIAQGNTDLSARTEQQACSLEETAASMRQMTETVEASAESAQQANQLAESASRIAGKGGDVVAKVVETMASIQESSRRIADITGVIDGLAFQTNILALNASVEAARAGTNGRGFAVVAAEVRNLAQRCAQSAGEIKTLIGASVTRVENGSTLVGDAGRTMGEVVEQVRHVTTLIAEVTDATRRQSMGIREVNAAVTVLDAGTQQNAALVEESMAAARMLRDQAERMAQTARCFRIDRSRVAIG